jgi:hypothetical protein
MSWWNDPKYNLIGKTFGRLTVTHGVNEVGRRRWACRCECGKRTEVTSNNLKGGKVVSCGCALKGCNRKAPFLWLYNRLLSDPRKFEKSITFEQFLEFTREPNCFYCDDTVVWSPFSRNKQKGGAYNLDRKDSSTGYTKDNLVVCCTRCNRAKGDWFTFDEFVRLGKVIQTFA